MTKFKDLSLSDNDSDSDSELQARLISNLHINEHHVPDELEEDVSMQDYYLDSLPNSDRKIDDNISFNDRLSTDVDMRDLTIDENSNDSDSEPLAEDHSKLYNILLNPTLEGCRLASGHTSLPTPVSYPKKDKPVLKTEATDATQEIEDKGNVLVADAEAPPDDSTEMIPNRPQSNVGTLYPPNNVTKEQMSGPSGSKYGRPIFINQNNYFENYNRYGGDGQSNEISSKEHCDDDNDNGNRAWRRPYILSTYIQVIINTITTSYMLYQVYLFMRVIKRDVSISVDNELLEGDYKIKQCYNRYKINHCEDQNLPALQEQCAEWHKCMRKQPYMLINYSELIVSILGSLANKLLESFSIKSVSLLATMLLATYAWNFICGYIRAKMFYNIPLLKAPPHELPAPPNVALLPSQQSLELVKKNK